MLAWGWVLSGALGIAVILLCVKLCMLRRAMDEMASALADRLGEETNTLIDVSVRDPHVRAFAAAINVQLRALRADRHRFRRGDAELKEAVANISHDLRTPLTAICGYLTLLEQEEQSTAAARYLAIIGNRTEVLKQLVEELFTYSIITSVRDESLERLSVDGVLEESLAAAYSALSEQGIEPRISLPTERVERMLNRSALMRIFGNILSNAQKYSDGDFEVCMDDTGRIVFANAAKALDAVMTARLFDRFYTVETGRNATGLGLSIAKLLTERMGGSISADYRDGRLFITVWFP